MYVCLIVFVCVCADVCTFVYVLECVSDSAKWKETKHVYFYVFKAEYGAGLTLGLVGVKIRVLM